MCSLVGRVITECRAMFSSPVTSDAPWYVAWMSLCDLSSPKKARYLRNRGHVTASPARCLGHGSPAPPVLVRSRAACFLYLVPSRTSCVVGLRACRASGSHFPATSFSFPRTDSLALDCMLCGGASVLCWFLFGGRTCRNRQPFQAGPYCAACRLVRIAQRVRGAAACIVLAPTAPSGSFGHTLQFS